MLVPTRGQAASKRTKTKNARKKEKKEMTKLGKALRLMGSTAGGTIGGYIGHPLAGASIGNSLGAALSKWLGSGDYQVQKNTLLSVGDIPMMHKTGQSVTVRHKEFVMELTGNQNFTVNRSLVLNPGVASSFPWLAGISQNYQEYRIKGMVFHYIPSSGNAIASTNTALGTVMFQTTYRSSDSVPTSKIEMLNEYCANETVPSESLAHPIECDPKENPFQVMYVRGQNPPTGDSVLLYDLGVTHIATSGQQVSGKVLGDVWVTYEVEFKKPVVTSNVGYNQVRFATYLPDSSTPANFFRNFNSPTGGIVAPTTHSVSFDAVPGKDYLVTIGHNWDNTSQSWTRGPVSLTGAVGFSYNSLPSERFSTGGAVTNGSGYLMISATATTVVIDFTSFTIAAGTTSTISYISVDELTF